MAIDFIKNPAPLQKISTQRLDFYKPALDPVVVLKAEEKKLEKDKAAFEAEKKAYKPFQKKVKADAPLGNSQQR